jgi:hypothetical protein
MLRTLLDRHGVITRTDALAAAGAYRVRIAQETGALISPWTGVLVDGTRATDARTLAAAALRLAGPAAVLAGPTAAHLHGCTAVVATPVHLVVPYEHPLRSRASLVVHNGPMPENDRTTLDGLPALTLERVVTDLLCRAAPQDALAVADEALAQLPAASRERFRAAVAERLASRRDPRGTVRARRLLGLATGRAESPPESRLLFRVVDAGYPVPEVNWWLTDINDRPLHRLDLAWPELRIALEYHGYAAHVGRTAEDDARAEDIRRRGWIHIDVWNDEVASPRLEVELDEAFRRRGVDLTG